ncbi:hypothetical protein ACWWJF_27025 [Symbiopectobacterium sp. Eva_TO]
MADKKQSTDKLAKWHVQARTNFDKAWSGSQKVREKIVEAQRFVRVAGAQWEGL